MLEQTQDFNKRLAEGERRIIPHVGAAEAVCTLLRACGWYVTPVDFSASRRGTAVVPPGCTVLDLASDRDPREWRARVLAAGGVKGKSVDSATFMGALANPFHSPEVVEREARKLAVNKAQEVDDALAIGARHIVCYAGIVETVAAELRQAGGDGEEGKDDRYFVATEYTPENLAHPKGPLGVVLVADHHDPEPWLARVLEAAGIDEDDEAEPDHQGLDGAAAAP
jgi:hypothetical protein